MPQKRTCPNCGHDIGLQGHSRAKLNANDVREIKRLLREGEMLQVDIAAQFNISRSMVSQIKAGIHWKETV